MLKDKGMYTDKLANKAFLLDKYDLEQNKGGKPMETDIKEHMVIKFSNQDKMEEFKKIRTDYESCLKLNQMWISYIDNLVGDRYQLKLE